jgi:hypothetical protein
MREACCSHARSCGEVHFTSQMLLASNIQVFLLTAFDSAVLCPSTNTLGLGTRLKSTRPAFCRELPRMMEWMHSIQNFPCSTLIHFPSIGIMGQRVRLGSAQHEANVERVNSAAERLSDPNMKPETLRKYVYIARNLDICGIDFKAVRQRYIQKYGGLSLPPNVSMVVTSCACYCLWKSVQS